MEITEIGYLAIKAESTYGTDPVPTVAANCIPAVGDSLSWSVGSTPVPRKILDGTLDRLIGFNTMPNVTLKFRYELRGNRTTGATDTDISSGAEAQAVEIDALLKAANLTPTYTPETSNGARDGSVSYKPAIFTTQGPSVTCYWYTALKLHKLIGGKVNIDKITCEAGKMAFIDFTVQGKYAAPTDITFSALAPVWLDTKPPLFNPSTMVIGTETDAVISSFEVELGNTIAMRPDALSSDNIAGFVITDFNPKGRVNPETVSVASYDWWLKWFESTVQPLILINGSQSGNKFAFSGVAEYKSVNYADANKVRIHQIEFDLVRSTLGLTPGTQFNLSFS